MATCVVAGLLMSVSPVLASASVRQSPVQPVARPTVEGPIPGTVPGDPASPEVEETYPFSPPSPTNIGVDEQICIKDLVTMVADIAGKDLTIRPGDGPLGVANRSFSHDRIAALAWKPEVNLREGMERTYAWVDKQVAEAGSPRGRRCLLAVVVEREHPSRPERAGRPTW